MESPEQNSAIGALLVHGAMHGAWSWERVTPHLDAAGVRWHAFDRWTPTEPPFVISDEAENEALIRRHIDLAPFDSSVVVCHSAAGVAATMACADNPKVAHIIYLAAFMTGGGIAPALEDDLVAALRVHQGGEVSVDPAKTADLYYHDCDPADAAAATRRLLPQAPGLFDQPSPSSARVGWRQVSHHVRGLHRGPVRAGERPASVGRSGDLPGGASREPLACAVDARPGRRGYCRNRPPVRAEFVNETTAGAQTLRRGLAVLSLIGANPNGLRISEIAETTGINRSAVGRILSALEAEGYVVRRNGVAVIGYGATRLAVHSRAALIATARPFLEDLASAVNATAALSVGIGDEAECVESVEPPGSLIHVAYCPGLRHPHNRGASGRAVAASLPSDPTNAESARIRRVGFAASSGELQSGAHGVAAPVYGTPMGASLAVIGLDDSVMSAATTGPLVKAAAALTRILANRAHGTPL